jgi:hypothetical protein
MGGVVQTESPGIETAFLNYFDALFQATQQIGVAECLSGLAPKVTEDMNVSLLKPCTVEEVCSALMSMGPHKAWRPDEFCAVFCQQNWSNVGEEVCSAITNFMRKGGMFEKINYTYIVLIPKKPNPISISDLRPISL